LRSGLTVFFTTEPITLSAYDVAKIDQLIPIVAETEQIPNRQNSRLKSKPQISDGSGRRFFFTHRKNLRLKISALRCVERIEWE